jgi:hypothetical protein
MFTDSLTHDYSYLISCEEIDALINVIIQLPKPRSRSFEKLGSDNAAGYAIYQLMPSRASLLLPLHDIHDDRT